MWAGGYLSKEKQLLKLIFQGTFFHYQCTHFLLLDTVLIQTTALEIFKADDDPGF